MGGLTGRGGGNELVASQRREKRARATQRHTAVQHQNVVGFSASNGCVPKKEEGKRRQQNGTCITETSFQGKLSDECPEQLTGRAGEGVQRGDHMVVVVGGGRDTVGDGAVACYNGLSLESLLKF